MTIDEIISKAIPKVTCHLEESYNIERRRMLKIRIEKLLEERDKTKPFIPAMEYKNG